MFLSSLMELYYMKLYNSKLFGWATNEENHASLSRKSPFSLLDIRLQLDYVLVIRYTFFWALDESYEIQSS